MALLSVSGLSRMEEGKTAVKDIHFTQRPFEQIAIAGETGSGKTSLLKMIAGLMQPTSGQIVLEGTPVKGPDEQLIPGNKNIAYLSQHFELRNNYRVHEVLDMANRLDISAANKIYAICRIEHLLQRWTDELSGGEKQRIALARLLSTSPKLLLLDEPFSNLDMLHKTMMKSVLKDACEQMRISSILVSHDAPDILSWADTVFLFKDGSIIQRGAPLDVYNRPINEYSAGLLGAYNLIDVTAFENDANDSANKKLFARPENIVIDDASTGGLKGTVKNILFWGSYYTVDIAVGKQLIRTQTLHSEYTIGQEVSVGFTSKNRWYL